MKAHAVKVAPAATLDDLLAIPEEERRHELIDGAIVEKERPRASTAVCSAGSRRASTRSSAGRAAGVLFGDEEED